MQGMHKISRGYLPNATYSSHFIRLPQAAMLLQRFLKQEAQQMEAEIEYLTAESTPFKAAPRENKDAVELRSFLQKAQDASAGS
jgi:uncharacterized protein